MVMVLHCWLFSLFPEFDNIINAFGTSFNKYLLNTTVFSPVLSTVGYTDLFLMVAVFKHFWLQS